MRTSGLKLPSAIIGLCLAAPPSLATQSDAGLEARLVGQAQALVDAVASGDRAVWERILDDAGLFVDEEAHVRTKSEVIGELRPLPPGSSGQIRLVNPRLARERDVAVLTYDLLETEIVEGQTINARYHQIDVYRELGGAWRLFASQVTVLPAEAAPLGPPSRLSDFMGTYSLGPEMIEITAAHVEQVSVATAHAGQGLGALLIDHLGALARADGRPALTLTTFRDVPWNAPYYRRLGFVPVDPADQGPELAALVAREAARIPGDAPRVAMRRGLGSKSPGELRRSDEAASVRRRARAPEA